MFNRNRTSELVVKHRVSSHSKIFIWAILTLGVLVAGGAIYRYGLSQGGFEFSLASLQQSQFRNTVKQLQGENQELRQTLARAERGLQMDEATYKELDVSLKSSAKQIASLREEISFYRNILSPANKQPGVRIQSLRIEHTDKTSMFHYKLVVIQALKHERQVYGRAKFEITGLQAGKNKVLRYPGVNARAIIVNFKYSQDIKGKFKLPENFTPSRVKVSVTTRGSNGRTIEKEYDWPKKGKRV